eukprot:COSAG05_NODE_301_length_11860_cov_30.927812_5_plen_276_part_00
MVFANQISDSAAFRGSIFLRNLNLSLRGLAAVMNFRGDPCKYDEVALTLGAASAWKQASDIKREQLRCRLDIANGMYFSATEKGPELCKCKPDPERGFAAETSAGEWAEAPCDSGRSGQLFAAPGGVRRRHCGIDPRNGRARWDAEILPDNSQCSFAPWPTCTHAEDDKACQAAADAAEAAALREGGPDIHVMWGVGTHRKRKLVDGCAAFTSSRSEGGWKDQGTDSGLPGAAAAHTSSDSFYASLTFSIVQEASVASSSPAKARAWCRCRNSRW